MAFKACFVGLGSIGSRHLNNLSGILLSRGVELEAHALRSSDSPLADDIRSLVSREVQEPSGLDSEYDAVIISNPTSMHFETLKELSSISSAFFVEKPLFATVERSPGELQLPKGVVCHVACPLRFTSVVRYLKEYLSKHKAFSARAICSSYLPEWRPGKDYRHVYSASREMGGGVRIDLIHEWDYATYLFGIPREVELIYGRYSGLEIDSEDLAAYIARFDGLLYELHLDYFGRSPKRTIDIYTDDHVVTGDIRGSKILIDDVASEIFFEEPNDKYLREMEYFLSVAARERESMNTLEAAYSVLGLALGHNSEKAGTL
jgi:predicted dehydrogenase